MMIQSPRLDVISVQLVDLIFRLQLALIAPTSTSPFPTPMPHQLLVIVTRSIHLTITTGLVDG
jgi:hypothetical protein